MFVDLENISWLRASGLQAITSYLSAGYGPVQGVFIFANPDLAQRFRQTMQGYSFKLLRVDTRLTTVDEAVKCELLNQLPRLPRSVVLLTGDTDFVDLVDAIGKSGRQPVVIASDGCAGSSLCQAANRWIGAAFLATPTDQQIMLTAISASAKRARQHVNGSAPSMQAVKAQAQPTPKRSSKGPSWPGGKTKPKAPRIQQEPAVGKARARRHLQVPPPPQRTRHACQPQVQAQSEGWFQRLQTEIKDFVRDMLGC